MAAEEKAEMIITNTKVSDLNQTKEDRKQNIQGVITQANNAWKDLKEEDYDPKNKNASNRILVEIRKNYNELHVLCPIVLQMMVHEKRYSSKALRNILKTQVKDKDQYLKLQASYVMELFIEDNPNMPRKYALQYRTKIHEKMVEEDKEFMKANEQYEEEKKKFEDEKKLQAVEQLKKSLAALKK